MARLVLYRPGMKGPVRYVPEDAVTAEPAESRRGGLAAERWLVNNYYAFPKSGPYSDRVRLCPPEQAEELLAIDAEVRDLERRRAEVREEAWRRADRYRGPGCR